MSNPPAVFFPAPAVRVVPALDDYIQPNLGHPLRIWWAYYWPTTLITLVGGFVLRIVVQVLWQNFIFSAKPLMHVNRFGPYIINDVAALFILHYVLGKIFVTFAWF